LTRRPQQQTNDSSSSASTSDTPTPTPSRIIAQLPSPPETMNSISDSSTHSTLNLDDNAPSRPSTPQPRGRSSSRYPNSLGPGHVPLHRRGTSKTYERLEDLLREAGYKETRVFTPETERAEIEAEERKERALVQGQNGTVKGGVGVVVGFLAGLMSRNPSHVREADGGESSRTKSPVQQEYSPPPSPLAQNRRLKTKQFDPSSVSYPQSPSPPTRTFTSSVESLPRSPLGSSSNLNPNYRMSSSNSNATPRAHLQVPHSRSSRLRPQPSLLFTDQDPQPYVQASKARAYLRHMASAPSIQPSSKAKRELLHRHVSSRAAVGRGYARRTVVVNDSDSEYDEHMRRRGNGEGEEESGIDGRPPLPRTWLESVARAVLFGGTGAHIGGPHSPLQSHPQSPKSRVEPLRMSPSSSNSALSDHTNIPRKNRRAPPLLCAQVVAQRTPSEGRVSRTRVFCRSAPTSRSGSKVRGGDRATDGRVNRGREKYGVSRGKEKVRERKVVKGRGRERLEVPSLARTQAQNDGWTRVDGDMCTSSSEDEDEDEGELDLARLLVPSKRQNSIRSLRQHLHGPSQGVASRSGTSSAAGSMRGRGGSRRESWDEEDEREQGGDRAEDWRRRIWGREGGSLRARYERDTWEEGEGEGDTFEGFLETGTSGTSTSTKRRRGIPGAWAQ
jgi:hypothetical protein